MPTLIVDPRITSAKDVSKAKLKALNLQPDTLESRLTLRVCDRLVCDNHGKLNKCSRCKIAMYCSKECQRQDWPRHKSACQLSESLMNDQYLGGELPISRHLRLWTARFKASLVCATIVALELNAHPENIDNFGLLVNLRPRPHAEAGSRFELVSAAVVPMVQMHAILAGFGDLNPAYRHRVLQLHEQNRNAIKRSSHGQEDYATAIVIADNSGPHVLPGGSVAEIRFKPIGVHKDLVRSAMLTDATLDWYTALRTQVQMDVPNRQLVVD